MYKFGECQKAQLEMDGKVDGCQEYVDEVMGDSTPDTCGNCGCLRGFHSKTLLPVRIRYKIKTVYTKCLKIHDFMFRTTTDGCQEFAPAGNEGTEAALKCTVCGCHRGFHYKCDTTAMTNSTV